jgi:hypothetical protein
MVISEEEIVRVRNGERACVQVSPEYFSGGDYTHWQCQSEETKNMEYKEFREWLIENMKWEYESIVLYSNGALYGYRGGIAHDISYNEFDDVETFIELAEEYSIG